MIGARAYTLVKALPLYAQLMIADPRLKGVRVVGTHGETAATDGKVIRLPQSFLVPKSNMDEAEESAWRDYAYGVMALTTHEVGHVIHTDFPTFQKAASDGPDSRRKHVLNLLEDPRIDALMVREQPGVAPMYDALGQRLVREGKEQSVTAEDAPGDALMGWMHHHARGTILGERAYEDLRDQSRPVVEGHFGKAFVDSLEEMIEEVRFAKSTQQVLSITDRILAYLDEAAKPPEPPEADPNEPQQQGGTGPQQQGGQGGGSGQESEAGPSQGGGSSTPDGQQGKDQAQGQGSSQGTAPDPNPATNPAGLDADQAKKLADALTAPSKDVTAARDEAIQQSQQQAAQAQQQAGARDTEADYSGGAGGGGAGGDTGTQGLQLSDEPMRTDHINAVSATARVRLRALLNGMAMDDVEIRSRGSRLSLKHAHRIALNDPRVWKHRIEGEAIDTAVFLLMDVSGSMDGQIATAREAAYATAMALRGIEGVTTAVGTFPGNGLVMPFGGSPMTHGPRFSFNAFGGTPMGAGVRFACRQMVVRPESRKLMIVVTDGCPDSQQDAVNALSMATGIGIETIGIGLGTQSVRHLFPVSEVLQDIQQLPNVLFATLKQQLLHRPRAA